MKLESLQNYSANIYLSGFMASGKSTLGKILAQKTQRPFLDLDDVIEQKEGKEIKDIFKDRGEAYFRQKEREYLEELAQNFRGIVALGGGALQNQQMVETLKKSGLLIFIDTPMNEILKRVKSSSERPILYNEAGEIKSDEVLFAELKTLYSQRDKFYKQAHLTITSSSYSSAEEMSESAIEKILRHV